MELSAGGERRGTGEEGGRRGGSGTEVCPHVSQRQRGDNLLDSGTETRTETLKTQFKVCFNVLQWKVDRPGREGGHSETSLSTLS